LSVAVRPISIGAVPAAEPAIPRCAFAGAQQARECHNDPHERGGGEDGRQTHEPRLFTERICAGREERNERRLIGETESRVTAANDEVQFVAKEIVSIRKSEMKRRDRGR